MSANKLLTEGAANETITLLAQIVKCEVLPRPYSGRWRRCLREGKMRDLQAI